MTIFIEPSECRDNTRLPQSVIEAGQLLPNLEQYTGADLLISTLRMPPLRLCDDSELSQINLRKHIDSGLLVQRKTGRDLTGSIQKLPDILIRMKAWTAYPWLLIVGVLTCDREGNCIIDGENTGYSYAAVDGALSWWQLRGGYVTVLSRDGLIANWINGWIERLKKVQEERIHQVFRIPAQALVTVPMWVQTLATFPNIGPDRAMLIADKCGDLATAIEYLSDPTYHIDGIGKETINRARQFLTLPEGIGLKMAALEDSEGKEKTA